MCPWGGAQRTAKHALIVVIKRSMSKLWMCKTIESTKKSISLNTSSVMTLSHAFAYLHHYGVHMQYICRDVAYVLDF